MHCPYAWSCRRTASPASGDTTRTGRGGEVQLDPGDVEEGLRAAAAIGDDRLQRMAGRSISPESFTHGSSEQRVAWFRRGLESGDPDSCNTFQ